MSDFMDNLDNFWNIARNAGSLKSVLDKVLEMFHGQQSLNFTMLGPSGVGKTCLLACMHDYFTNVMSGFFIPSGSTIAEMSGTMNRFRFDCNNPQSTFRTTTTGTQTARHHTFKIAGDRNSVDVGFWDFPGAWMDSRSSNYKTVEGFVAASQVILVAMETPYLMEKNGLYHGLYNDPSGVHTLIANAMVVSDGPKLVIFVPVKCEKYMAPGNSTKKLIEAIKMGYMSTIKLKDNDCLSGRLAMAVLPVQTAGNVHFGRFDMNDLNPDGVPAAVYYKPKPDSSMNYMDCDQPMRYLVSYLMKLQEDSKSIGYIHLILDRLFADKKMKDVVRSIRNGMKILPEEGVDIIVGQNMIVRYGS